MRNFVPLFLLLVLIASCTPSTEQESASETSPEQEEVQQEEQTNGTTANKEVLTELATDTNAEEVPQAMSATRAIISPIDQKVEMVPEVLGPLCQNKYGCIEEVIYPLGWSADGKFAYLLEAANEAVENYTLQLFIQDMETDKIVAEKVWKASDQPGWTEEQGIDFTSVWASEGAAFREILAEHQIQEGNGNDFIRLPYQIDGRSYEFKSKDTMVPNDYIGEKVIGEHELMAEASGLGQKRISKQAFGKYDMVQKTNALGLFKSPFEDRVAVLDAAEYRGYEGPPNVLKFKLVGCRLKDGY